MEKNNTAEDINKITSLISCHKELNESNKALRILDAGIQMLLRERIKTLESAMQLFIDDSCHSNNFDQGMPAYKTQCFREAFEQLLEKNDD